MQQPLWSASAEHQPMFLYFHIKSTSIHRALPSYILSSRIVTTQNMPFLFFLLNYKKQPDIFTGFVHLRCSDSIINSASHISESDITSCGWQFPLQTGIFLHSNLTVAREHFLSSFTTQTSAALHLYYLHQVPICPLSSNHEWCWLNCTSVCSIKD